MPLKNVALAICVVFGLIGTRAAYAENQPTSEAVEMVNKATNAFYDALNRMFVGEVGPMKALWSHRDDVYFSGPTGGVHVGWDKVGPIWDAQANLKLGGKVEAKDVHTVVTADMAVVSNMEVGENVVDGKVEKVELRATSIFRKEDGEWKMIAHHTDLMPWLVAKQPGGAK